MTRMSCSAGWKVDLDVAGTNNSFHVMVRWKIILLGHALKLSSIKAKGHDSMQHAPEG